MTSISIETSDPEERAAWLAAKAFNTLRVLELDPLGRMFLRRNDNGSDGAPVYYDTRFELNIKGNKQKMIDARGMTTVYQTGLHDPKVGEEGEEEQLWSLIDNPDSGKTWLLPDVMNKPSYSWDSRGYRQRMVYDIAQRPLKKWVQAPNATNELLKQQSVYGETAAVPRTKNLLGQAYEQHDQAGKQSYTAYDFKGNLKTEARQFAQVFDAILNYSGSVALQTEIYSTSYAYDALDRPTGKTTPDNSTATYIYAKNAMLQSQSIEVRASGNTEQAINDITYNAKGQRTDIYYANGSKTKYVYDLETFRIIRILTTKNNGQEILQDLHYTFDAAGNITQMKDDAQQTIYFNNQVVAPICKYTNDSLYRLKKATGRENSNLNQPSHEDIPISTPIPDGTSDACRNYTLNYTYDELGNILKIQHIASGGNWTRNYFYPSDSNKLIGHTSGQTDYTYDASGNMLTMPHLNEMIWDEDDMLVEADLGGGGTAYYRNDSQGQRVRKVVVNGSTKKERFYIGEWELWQQYTNNTIETNRETLSIADDEKTFLQLETLTIDGGSTVSTPNTNWRYQYDNHLRSACLELDDSAAVISYEEYYPFGVTSYRSGKSQSEVKLKKYRYCGKEKDEETGLYYYGARYYAAWIGRFISIDPLAEKFPQLTPYNYAGNKPVTYKDLHGLQSDGGENEVKTDNGEINNNAFPDTTGVQQLNEVVIITDSRGTDLTNSGYTQEDYRVRSKVLNDEGPVATALRSAEAKGIFRPLYDPSGHFDGFAENFAAGHKNFDPDGLANFWMNAAAFGIGIPLLAGVGGSYGGVQLSKSAVKPLFKMGIDAGSQYLLTDQIDYADVAIGGFTSPMLSPALGGFIDITNEETSIYGIYGSKSLKSTTVDVGTGYVMYGIGKYGDSVLSNYKGAEKFGVEMYNHIVTSLGGTFMNSKIQETTK